jgi:hypothetical protein
MAKGTKVSDVNFSIPEGADPMGIGIPDLGRSSYDPLDTIRRGWEKSRQDRIMKRQERREDWKERKAKIPTFESVNQAVAKKLNDKTVEMSNYLDQQFRAGQFAPWAKTEGGEKVWQKLNTLEQEIASEGEAYNKLLPKYKAAQDFISNPANDKKIDWDVTNKRMNEFVGAKDLEDMTMAAAGNMVALKPTPIAMMKEVTTRLGEYMDEESVQKIAESWDPTTNKLRIDETTGVDTAELERSMLKIYEDLQAEGGEEFANEITARYNKAPQSEKVTADGIPIDEKAWFVGRYSPSYAEKIKTSYVAKSDEGGVNWLSMFGGISKKDDGTWNLTSPTVKQIDRQRPTQVNKGTEKKPKWEDAMEQVPEQYYSHNVELSGVIDKPFAMESSTDTYNQQTGERIPAGLVVYEQPTNVSMMPTAADDITVTMPDKTEVTVAKGDLIRKEVHDQMSGQGEKVYWDWFVTSASQIKKTPEGGVEAERRAKYGDEYMPTHQVTTMRPWNDAKNAILAEASTKYDLTEMANAMEQMKKQKNSGVESILQQVKELTAEEAYNAAFGNK